MGSSRSCLPLAPLADRELSPQAGAAAAEDVGAVEARAGGARNYNRAIVYGESV